MLHFTRSLKKELSFYGFEQTTPHCQSQLKSVSLKSQDNSFQYDDENDVNRNQFQQKISQPFSGNDSRAASIENQIKQSYGIPPKTIADIPDDAMMNIDLF